MDFVVKNLIEFKPHKTQRELNESDVSATGLVDSETFLRDLDVDFVKKCCAILSYQLRMKHDVALQFSPENLNDENSRDCYRLFWSISSFGAYLKECATFAQVFRDSNDRVASLLRDNNFDKSAGRKKRSSAGGKKESASIGGKRKRDGNFVQSDSNNDTQNREFYYDENIDDENDNDLDNCRDDNQGAGVVDDDENYLADDLRVIFDQYQNMQQIFGAYIDMFLDANFDRYVIYMRFMLDCTLSRDIPLTLSADTFNNLQTLFPTLLRLTVASTDFCNTQMSAFFGPGMMINMLLYLTSNETISDALNLVAERKKRKNTHEIHSDIDAERDNDAGILSHETYNADTTCENDSSALTPPVNKNRLITHWTRLSIKDREDYDSAFLLRDIDSDEYRRCVASLSPSEFSAEQGHVFMSKGDTLATLFLQFVSRLFYRLYEWPERHDVKCHLERYFQCDNIATFFAQVGRQNQAWIKFFKRRQQKPGAESTSEIQQNELEQMVSAISEQGTNSTSSGFLHKDLSTESVDEDGGVTRKRSLPLVYINMSRLHSLYDSVAYGFPANQPKVSTAKRQRLDVASVAGTASGVASPTLLSNGAAVKAAWDSLVDFKHAYVDFFVKGCSKDESYRRWFVQRVTDFALRSGGFRENPCPRHHPMDVEMNFDTGCVRFSNCETCTLSLYRQKSDDDKFSIDFNDSIFTFKRWAEEVNNLLFPYNFLLSSVAYANNGRKFDDDTLSQVWIFKTQEVLVSRRFTADKCRRCLEYFEKLSKLSRFVVEESNLKKIFASLLRDLPFLQDFFDTPVDDNDTVDDDDEMDCD